MECDIRNTCHLNNRRLYATRARGARHACKRVIVLSPSRTTTAPVVQATVFSDFDIGQYRSRPGNGKKKEMLLSESPFRILAHPITYSILSPIYHLSPITCTFQPKFTKFYGKRIHKSQILSVVSCTAQKNHVHMTNNKTEESLMDFN